MTKRSDNPLDVYLAHRSALVDYAMPIVGSRAQAEDVVQEAWLRFNGRAAEQAGIHNPVSYLYRIVRNLALDLSRRLQTENRQPDGDEMLLTLAVESASPEHSILYQDELRMVQQALDELPERTRQTFILHRINGLPLQQIAIQLNISTSLAHQLVHSALSHCAERLTDD